MTYWPKSWHPGGWLIAFPVGEDAKTESGTTMQAWLPLPHSNFLLPTHDEYAS
jgi:hypothetical protein